MGRMPKSQSGAAAFRSATMRVGAVGRVMVTPRSSVKTYSPVEGEASWAARRWLSVAVAVMAAAAPRTVRRENLD